MEGIQHRWDCPAKTWTDRLPVTDYLFTRSDGTRVTSIRCPDCGRAAIIHKPKQETSDEH